MFSKIFSATAVVLAATSMVEAQTFTDCNPMEKSCPDDIALGTTVSVDFTKGANSFFKVAEGTKMNYDGSGAVFTINKETDAPTIVAQKYIFFGKVDVTLAAAPGAGIITSVVLQSDNLDEIDWEWVGSDTKQVQTNYFGKGDTTTYDRGKFHDNTNPQTEVHTYTIDWTKDYVRWLIDGKQVRELLYADAKEGTRFPQTPMQLKLGSWVAGRKDAPEGTVQWGGGYADFSKGPFLAHYKSITVQDYTQGATKYSFGDKSGSYQSIKVTKGDNSNSDNSVSSSSPSPPSSTSSPPPASSTDKPTSVKSITFTPESTLVSSGASTLVTATTTGSSSSATSPSGSSSGRTSGTSSSATATPSANGAFKQGLEMSNMVVMGAGLFFGYLLL